MTLESFQWIYSRPIRTPKIFLKCLFSPWDSDQFHRNDTCDDSWKSLNHPNDIRGTTHGVQWWRERGPRTPDIHKVQLTSQCVLSPSHSDHTYLHGSITRFQNQLETNYIPIAFQAMGILHSNFFWLNVAVTTLKRSQSNHINLSSTHTLGWMRI
jgi:hypothetical protein